MYLKVTFSLLLMFFSCVSSAPEEDLIVNLPGLPSRPSFKQYSGYLNVDDGNKLHYWFVECRENPAQAPVLLWLTGGPGCSSLFAFFTEHGPFQINPVGSTLIYSPTSWNRVANVIYLESPAGVGFSYSASQNYTTDDDITASNNMEAIIQFFIKFPEYSSNDFYLGGGGYAGIYVPTLALRLLPPSTPIPLKGLVVENGIHDRPLYSSGRIFFAGSHGLFEKRIMDALLTYCCDTTSLPLHCDFYRPTHPKCQSAIGYANVKIRASGVNMYSIYSKCVNSSEGHPYRFRREIKDSSTPCLDPVYLPKYLNQPAVRKALHVPEEAPIWEMCSETVSRNYTMLYETMRGHYESLPKDIRVLIYHGDTDALATSLSGEWFVASLNREVLIEYTKWTYRNQTAGFYQTYPSLTFATVLGAGQMPPTDRPRETFKLVSLFLYNKPLY